MLADIPDDALVCPTCGLEVTLFIIGEHNLLQWGCPEHHDAAREPWTRRRYDEFLMERGINDH